MEELRPAFEAIAQVIRTLANSLVTAFAAMVPLIVKVAEFLAFLAQGIEAVSRPLIAFGMVLATLYDAIAEFIAGLFGDDAKTGMASFKDAMVDIARLIVLAVAKIAMALGQLDFVAKLQKAFDKKVVDPEDPTGTKAAMNPAFMSFDAFGAAVDKNASIATGDGKDAQPEDWLKKISEDLKAMQNGEKTILDKVIMKLEEIREALLAPVKGTYEAGSFGAGFALDVLSGKYLFGK